jgi:hypothetical protein
MEPEQDDSPLIGINLAVLMRQNATLYAHIPTLAKDDLLELKLHGFDFGGIWVENQKLTDMVLEILNKAATPTTPVFFVPYSAIHFACTAVEGQSLSAGKLGL